MPAAYDLLTQNDTERSNFTPALACRPTTATTQNWCQHSLEGAMYMQQTKAQIGVVALSRHWMPSETLVRSTLVIIMALEPAHASSI